MILFYILFIGLTGFFSACFSNKYSKYSWIFDIPYELSSNSNSSFDAGAEIFKRIILIWHFYIFSCIVNTNIW